MQKEIISFLSVIFKYFTMNSKYKKYHSLLWNNVSALIVPKPNTTLQNGNKGQLEYEIRSTGCGRLWKYYEFSFISKQLITKRMHRILIFLF